MSLVPPAFCRIMSSWCLAVSILGLALVVQAAVALAAGSADLVWGNECYFGGGPLSTYFTCNTNSASVSWPMTISFYTDMPFPNLVGLEVTLEGCPEGSTIPDWWKMSTGDCRDSKVKFSADFSSKPDAYCFQWAGPSAITTVSSHWSYDRAYIEAAASLPAGEPPVATERLAPYYAGRVTVLNGKTVGTDACTGCNQLFGWGVTQVRLHGADGGIEVLTNSWNNRWVTWNTWTIACRWTDPARTSTWGQVKSLYR